MDRMRSSDLVGWCLCGYGRGAHLPREEYCGEGRLEGRKSSSRAKRMKGCEGYRESGLTLSESMKQEGRT